MSVISIKKPILVCQLTQDSEILKPDEVTVTHDVLTCLNEATGMPNGVIIICFSVRQISVRNDILNLCKCLSKNHLTCKLSVFASIDIPHRELAQKMADAGVGFMEVRQSEAPIDDTRIMQLVQTDDPSIQIERLLDTLCPSLHYQPIDDHCELITCKHYRDRMVLGGKRLHDVCENANHLHCDYFLNPRSI